MKTTAYGAMPFEVTNAPSLRNLRWNLMLALAVDLAIWAVLISAVGGVIRLFQ